MPKFWAVEQDKSQNNCFLTFPFETTSFMNFHLKKCNHQRNNTLFLSIIKQHFFHLDAVNIWIQEKKRLFLKLVIMKGTNLYKLFFRKSEKCSKLANALSTGAVEYADCTTTEGKPPRQMKVLNWIWSWGFRLETLGNMEYPFILITPRFTLVRTGASH